MAEREKLIEVKDLQISFGKGRKKFVAVDHVNFDIYKGALYENMVGEALIKQGYKLFYYKKEDSTLEADFFIRSTASLIPVEVKAKSGRAKSMKTLIASDHYPDIRYGIKLSKNNIGHEDRIYTFPYFCAFLLKRFMAGFHAEEEAE